MSKYNNNKSKWIDARCFANKKNMTLARKTVEEESKKKAKELILKEYSAVVGKKTIENIIELQEEFIKTVQADDRVLTHKQYAALLSSRVNITLGIVDEMLAKELKKKNRNEKQLKWILKYIKDTVVDIYPEFRKTNFELDEMQHGKKRVNLNVATTKADLKDYLEDKAENVVDGEVVEDDNSGIDTDKK